MNATVHVFPNADEVAKAASGLLLAEARRALAARLRCVVLLSGGSTPRAMYRHLAASGTEAAEILRACDYFMGDERTVPVASPESNAGEAIRGFLDPVGVPMPQRYLPDGAASPPEEAERLTTLLRATVPRDGEGVPQFDLAFLGLGEDGHTASLFPGTKALGDTVPRYVANDVPQLATTRLTVTYPVLNAARHVVLLACGAGKAPILEDVAAGRGDHPFARVAPERMTWLLDQAAASRLSSHIPRPWSLP